MFADFMAKAEDDFKDGHKNFLDAAKGIINDGIGEMKGPLDGANFMGEAPKFLFDQGKAAAEGAKLGLKIGGVDVIAVGRTIAEGVVGAFDNLGAETKKKIAEGLEKALQKMKDAKLLQNDIDSMTTSMELQAKTFGMTSRQVAIYKLQLRGATDEQLKAARAADATLTAMEEQQNLINDGKSLTQSLRTEQEKYNDEMARFQKLLDGGAISQETFERAAKKAKKTLDEATKDKTVKIKIRVAGLDAIEAGTAAAFDAFNDFQTLKPPPLPEPPRIEPQQAPRQLVDQNGPRPAQDVDNKDEKRDAHYQKVEEALEQIVANTNQKPLVVRPAGFNR